MSGKAIVAALVLSVCSVISYADEPLMESQWNGKKVVYLGDSITDAAHVGCTKNYWGFLQDFLGIIPAVYGINGHQMSRVPGQIDRMQAELGDGFDAVMIFCGTNDFNASVPVGEWYTEKMDSVVIGGPRTVLRKHREHIMDNSTFKGRINIVLSRLKTAYPDRQIILLTPIHRAYAKFGPDNIQPDESWANEAGFYIDDYVQAVKEAGNVWAVPVIDVNSLSGLYPMSEPYLKYFANQETDRLHPNTDGHRRLALSIAYQLLGLWN